VAKLRVAERTKARSSRQAKALNFAPEPSLEIADLLIGAAAAS